MILHLFDPTTKILVRPIPKVAYRSMIKCLYQVKTEEFLNKINYNNVIAFIRDPIDRLISGFRFFKDINWHLKTDTYEEYVDRVFKENNEHWDSQFSILNRGIPAQKIFPFEQMNDIWEYFSLPKLEVIGKSIDYPVNKLYRIDELKQKYSADYELRKWL